MSINEACAEVNCKVRELDAALEAMLESSNRKDFGGARLEDAAPALLYSYCEVCL